MNSTTELHFGFFDGMRGHGIEMTMDEAQSASHQGRCDEDVAALTLQPAIAAQLDCFPASEIRDALKDVGAWDESDLADDDANRNRAVWLAACDIRENGGQSL